MATTALQAAPPARRRPFASIVGGIRQVADLMWLYWLHSPAGLIFMVFDAILLPSMIFYFGARLAHGDGAILGRYVAGGITTGLGVGATTKVGFAVLSDLQLGRLALLRCLGVGKARYVGALVATAVLFGLLSATVGLLVARATGLTEIGVEALPALMLVAAIGGGAMGAMGAAIATASRDYATGQGLLSIASLGLAFLSPVFYRLQDLPALLQAAAYLSPFTHTAAMVQAVLAGRAMPLDHMAVAAVLCLCLNLLAARAMKWQ